MRLVDVVTTAIAERECPSVRAVASLALVYAEQIDAATHITLGHSRALDEISAAVTAASEADPGAHAGAQAALDKLTAALSAVTVASDLGPKLLAALDALLVTPKARAAAGAAVAGAAPASPLQRLRERHDGRPRAVS